MAEELQHDFDIAQYDIRQRWRTRPPKEFPAKWTCEWGFDEYGLWQTFEVKGVSHKMRFIPKGSFLMGATEDEEGAKIEYPRHKVKLNKGFWLGETTVTQQLWQAIMGDNPGYFKAQENEPSLVEQPSVEQFPVETVSWHDCQQFCQKLSELAHAQFTLPTEAQWEYACRAGTNTAFNVGNTLHKQQANFQSKIEKTAEVHRYQPNNWGLKHMHGNVWEWCLDNRRQYQKEAATDPVGATAKRAADAVLRGGSWFDYGWRCRSAFRSYRMRDLRSYFIGLRVAQVEEAEETAGGA